MSNLKGTWTELFVGIALLASMVLAFKYEDARPAFYSAVSTVTGAYFGAKHPDQI